MNNVSMILLSLLILSVVKCSSHNMALEDARTSFKNASNDPMVKDNAPIQLHDADIALQAANKADRDGEKKTEVIHLANIASKRIEIAKIDAQKTSEEKKQTEISSDRSGVVTIAREKETKAIQEKNTALNASNAQLKNNAIQNQADATVLEAQASALALKNQEMEKELATLKMKPTSRGMELTLRDTVFEFGKSELTSGARRDLEKISLQLKNAPSRKILVEGHTDSIGTDVYNQALSERRAEAIKDVLAREIDSSRITARGLGKEYPVASNTTEAGRQQNRRVTIIVLPSEEVQK